MAEGPVTQFVTEPSGHSAPVALHGNALVRPVYLDSDNGDGKFDLRIGTWKCALSSPSNVTCLVMTCHPRLGRGAYVHIFYYQVFNSLSLRERVGVRGAQ